MAHRAAHAQRARLLGDLVALEEGLHELDAALADRAVRKAEGAGGLLRVRDLVGREGVRGRQCAALEELAAVEQQPGAELAHLEQPVLAQRPADLLLAVHAGAHEGRLARHAVLDDGGNVRRAGAAEERHHDPHEEHEDQEHGGDRAHAAQGDEALGGPLGPAHPGRGHARADQPREGAAGVGVAIASGGGSLVVGHGVLVGFDDRSVLRRLARGSLPVRNDPGTGGVGGGKGAGGRSRRHRGKTAHRVTGSWGLL